MAHQKFHVFDQGEQMGPWALDEIQGMWQRGELTPDVMVCEWVRSEWRMLRESPDLLEIEVLPAPKSMLEIAQQSSNTPDDEQLLDLLAVNEPQPTQRLGVLDLLLIGLLWWWYYATQWQPVGVFAVALSVWIGCSVLSAVGSCALQIIVGPIQFLSGVLGVYALGWMLLDGLARLF